MPFPSPPEIQTSYTAQEQALGDGTLPGQELDVDLASIRASVTAVIEFLKTSLRSDGRLANGSVSQDTLASSILIGFDPPAPWETDQAYTTRSTVFEGFGFYLCTLAHTSGTFSTDLASGRWVLLADLTPPGGALIASNNLNDLPDVGNARSNLGLGSMATASSGTGADQHRTNIQNEALFQPLAAALTAWAAITRASGFDTFVATPSSANLRALMTDESGSGALLFAGGAMGTPSSINLANASGLAVGGIAASTLVTSGEGIAANNDDLTIPTSAAVDAHVTSRFNVTGSAPLFGVRSWINLNGIPVIGATYTRTGTLVTVTQTGHGMSTGQGVFLNFTSGTATDGYYTVAVVDANTYTVVDAASGSTSGSVNRDLWVRASGNVASVVRNSAGDFTINFTVAMPDANFSAVGVPGNTTGADWTYNPSVYATTSVRGTVRNGSNIPSDPEFLNIHVVR